jgi:amidohydrolase
MNCFMPYIDKNYMIRVRRQLHMYPELSFDLPKTLALVRSELDKMNVKYTEKYGKSSIVAFLNEEKSGFTIAIRADMDALRMTEVNDVEYKSRVDGFMHACGHDVHTAALLGTIKALSAVRDKINCRLAFIFQASEEGPSGAKLMVEDGVTDEFDLIIGCHVDGGIDVGKILARNGPTLVSSDGFRIDIYGKTGHVATPHAAINALDVAIKIYNELITIPRKIDPTISNLIMIRRFSTGEKSGVYPDYCYMTGSVSTHYDDVSKYIRERIVELSEGISNLHRAKCEVKINVGTGSFFSNPVIAGKIREAARSISVLVEDPLTPPYMYGEDFAYYLKYKPGAYFFLGTRNIKKGITSMTHNNNFDVDEDSLECAAKVFCKFVFDCMDGITL